VSSSDKVSQPFPKFRDCHNAVNVKARESTPHFVFRGIFKTLVTNMCSRQSEDLSTSGSLSRMCVRSARHNHSVSMKLIVPSRAVTLVQVLCEQVVGKLFDFNRRRTLRRDYAERQCLIFCS
jgi:hypothetical protein